MRRWWRWTATPSTTSTPRARTSWSRAAPRGPAGQPARAPRRPLPDPRLPARRGHDRGRPVLLQRRVPGPGAGRRAVPDGNLVATRLPGRRTRSRSTTPAPARSSRTAYPTATTWSPSRRAPAHRDVRRRARRPDTRARARAPHLRPRRSRSARSPPGSPTRAARRCWHAERMGDPAPVPPGRRLRLRPAHRQPGRGGPRRRRPRRRTDAAVRAVDQPVRDDVPARAPPAPRPTTGCGSSPPSRELPFAGHPTLGSAHAWLEAGGTPRGDATSSRSAAPAWSPSAAVTGWRSGHRRCCGTVRSSDADLATITGPSASARDDIVDSEVVRQRPGLGRRTPRRRPRRPRPAARPGPVRRLGHRRRRPLDRRRL